MKQAYITRPADRRQDTVRLVRAQIFGDPVPDLMATLKEKAHLLKDTYGRIDVPWEYIVKMLEAAKSAPSSGNIQNWKYIIVKDKPAKKFLQHNMG